MQEDAWDDGTTAHVVRQLVHLQEREMGEGVYRAAALHVLDTFAAMVSGRTLPSGRSILDFARRSVASVGQHDCLVVGERLTADPITAARINGMLAHADETDDSHQASLSHPGCAVVPAALAMAESSGCSGVSFLRGVIAGYELTARLNLSLGPSFRDTRGSKHSSHAIGGVFGAAAASATVLRLDAVQTADVLAYVAQLASGVNAWLRDEQHVLKAFVFGGMPASNGVLAATLVRDGLPGMPAIFDGTPNFLETLSHEVQSVVLREAWGRSYAVEETNFKLHPVGSPAQAAVQAAETLAIKVKGDDVARVTIFLPPDSLHVVRDNANSNLNVKYLVAATLCEGSLSFERAHDEQAARRDPFATVIARTTVEPEAALMGTRGGCVQVEDTAGARWREYVEVPLGTSGAPLPDEDVVRKAEKLLLPTLGAPATSSLIDAVLGLAEATNLEGVAALLSLRGATR